LFIVVTLGTVDVAYMLFEWDLANKAAYVGARTAVVSDPVAQNITNPTYTSTQSQNIRQLCFDPATGNATSPANCPTPSAVCTPAASGGSCTNSYTFDDAALALILGNMQAIFPRLQRQNVQISYTTNGLGFVLQPGGLPMNVTVSITGMTHQFFFVPGLLGIFGGRISATPAIPAFSTTMQSEDMVTN
jgi:hypothetical protein